MIGSLRSEFRKAFTTRLWWSLTLIMALLAGAIAGGVGYLVGRPGGLTKEPMNAQLVYASGLNPDFGLLTALFPLTLGIVLTTTESRHKTWATTYWATPRRWIVTVTKMIAVVFVGIFMGVVHAATSVGTGVAVFKFVSEVPTYLRDPAVQRTVLASIALTGLWALLGYGFGVLLRHQIAAIAIAVSFVFIGQALLRFAFEALEWDTAASYLPDSLAYAILHQVPRGPNVELIETWWVAALVLAGYGLAMTFVGHWVSVRRDVT